MYKVRYMLSTHSRYGRYDYKFSDKIEANSAEEAVQIAKAKSKENHGHWKFRLLEVKEA